MDSFPEGKYEYCFDLSENTCLVFGRGAVNLSMTIQAMSMVTGDPRFRSDWWILADLSDIYFHPTYEELMSIKDHLLAINANRKNRIAVVVPDELYYVSLLISKIAQTSGLDICIFRNITPARTWLKS